MGFREENGFTFDDVKPIAHGNVGSILLPASQVPDKYVLSDKLWTYLQNYKKKHEAAGNGFGYGMVDAATDHTRTLSARYGKDGSEILVSRGEGKNPRRLTPRECARLMGYPDSFSIPVSDTQAYRQFGNSVAVTHRRSPTSKPHGTTRGATTRTAAPNGVSTTRTASQSAWPAPATSCASVCSGTIAC